MPTQAVTGQSDMPSELLPRTKEVKPVEKLENNCRTLASVMQRTRLPSILSVRPVPKEAEQEGGRGKPPAGTSKLHWRLTFVLASLVGCAGGQLGFVGFVGDCKLSVPCLLDLERKMFLSVFWKL